MTQHPLRVLLVANDPGDTRAIQDMLTEALGASLHLASAAHLAAALERLAEEGADVVLLDLSLAEAQAAIAVAEVKSARDLPVVALVSSDEDRSGLDALQEGAQDYLVKGQFDGRLLARAIRFAIHTHQLQTQLRDQAIFDPLTGLYNRRGFVTLAEHYFKLARRTQRSLVLTYIDLDGLQRINDEFGRAEGDQALLRVATVLRSHFRESDILARMAGDEFAFVALGASDRNSEALAARLGEGLHNLTQSDPPPYEISLSVGLVWFDPEHPIPLEELISRATAAMQEHKQRKRAA